MLLKAQIDNILDCGWKSSDVLLISNVDYEYLKVCAIKVELNDTCRTGSKMFAVEFVLDNKLHDGVCWAKDLDTWPNYMFDEPEIKDVGITTYSSKKLNGGSVFWKSSSFDIVKHVIGEINKGEETNDP